MSCSLVSPRTISPNTSCEALSIQWRSSIRKNDWREAAASFQHNLQQVARAQANQDAIEPGEGTLRRVKAKHIEQQAKALWGIQPERCQPHLRAFGLTSFSASRRFDLKCAANDFDEREERRLPSVRRSSSG